MQKEQDVTAELNHPNIKNIKHLQKFIGNCDLFIILLNVEVPKYVLLDILSSIAGAESVRLCGCLKCLIIEENRGIQRKIFITEYEVDVST